ncbi:hypothetical protein Mp_1g24490 [Marchantia polymorpha subsp. ruderalis]|uniref:Uncharacterized protein n=2 Tax=Marchantia polymorpha TaxID=3197 RepID=A0AAF6ATU7_MARPO|nr:hypothetical protein MARPO_0061s0072 [Marchantia polymorpha]BBM99867.1 hypothetical protein Mp_1g24490 [Marchantia polymorpha subsp. ruderalis]|eukprot:PTQ36817.1 hypothetical protein MARPO_0061s0072 [Marchantia polymorpha]
MCQNRVPNGVRISIEVDSASFVNTRRSRSALTTTTAESEQSFPFFERSDRAELSFARTLLPTVCAFVSSYLPLTVHRIPVVEGYALRSKARIPNPARPAGSLMMDGVRPTRVTHAAVVKCVYGRSTERERASGARWSVFVVPPSTLSLGSGSGSGSGSAPAYLGGAGDDRIFWPRTSSSLPPTTGPVATTCQTPRNRSRLSGDLRDPNTCARCPARCPAWPWLPKVQAPACRWGLMSWESGKDFKRGSSFPFR